MIDFNNHCNMVIWICNHLLTYGSIWLVVEPYPSEKWWTESQLGSSNSQYDGENNSNVLKHQSGIYPTWYSHYIPIHHITSSHKGHLWLKPLHFSCREPWKNGKIHACALRRLAQDLAFPKRGPQHPDMVQEGGLLVMFFGLSHYCNLANYGKSH